MEETYSSTIWRVKLMQTVNFGGNVEFNPSAAYVPNTEQEVLEILDRHKGQRIRCVGRLHSWSRAIEANDVVVDLRKLNQVVTSDAGGQLSVNVGAGCQIKRLLAELERQKNWTLPSLGLITEQSVAGAVSTATHGSGRNSLCHYVISARIARYDTVTGRATIDEIVGGDEIRAARCSLGSLGVILSVQMQCRSVYRVEESFHEYRDLTDVIAAEEFFPLQQFFLIPWRWSYMAQHRRETSNPCSGTAWIYRWYRFLTIDVAMHLLILLMIRVVRAKSLIRLMLRKIIPSFVVRDWFVIDQSTPQLVMEHELFRHIELELFVRREKLTSAMSFVEQVLCVAGGTSTKIEETFSAQLSPFGLQDELSRLKGIYCHHFPICVRKVLPDDALIAMSCHGHASTDAPHDSAWYAITFTCYSRGNERAAFEAVGRFLSQGMAALFSARPHWGKLCYLKPAELRSLYPRFEDFRKICREYDPDGTFQNDWTKLLLEQEGASTYSQSRLFKSS